MIKLVMSHPAIIVGALFAAAAWYVYSQTQPQTTIILPPNGPTSNMPSVGSWTRTGQQSMPSFNRLGER
jgi:hypothetical protein